jgi:hypothetical protein
VTTRADSAERAPLPAHGARARRGTRRRESSREELRAYAREIAAKAPEFTPAQIARLRQLLWGAVGQPPAVAAPSSDVPLEAVAAPAA